MSSQRIGAPERENAQSRRRFASFEDKTLKDFVDRPIAAAGEDNLRAIQHSFACLASRRSSLCGCDQESFMS
jgi:hypothetical protein